MDCYLLYFITLVSVVLKRVTESCQLFVTEKSEAHVKCEYSLVVLRTEIIRMEICAVFAVSCDNITKPVSCVSSCGIDRPF